MENRRRMMMSAGEGGKRDNNIIFYLHSVSDFMDERLYEYKVRAEYPVSSRVNVTITYFSDTLEEDNTLDYIIQAGNTVGSSLVVGTVDQIRYYAMEVSPTEDSKYRYIANGNW